MYLNSLEALPKILQSAHFLILITDEASQKIPGSFLGDRTAIPIPPSDKNTHDIETIRSIETLCRSKQTTPQTIILEQADLLTHNAQNAFLKLLEEPGDNISFIFTTSRPTSLLPTTLSRAKVFYLRTDSAPTPPDKTTLAQARSLVAGRRADLIPLANILAKDRDNALEVTRTAILLLHKSQLTKPTPPFLARLEKLLALEKALSQNGHIKLHIVNMVQ